MDYDIRFDPSAKSCCTKLLPVVNEMIRLGGKEKTNIVIRDLIFEASDLLKAIRKDSEAGSLVGTLAIYGLSKALDELEANAINDSNIEQL